MTARGEMSDEDIRLAQIRAVRELIAGRADDATVCVAELHQALDNPIGEFMVDMAAPGPRDLLAWLDRAISKAEADADRWHDVECESHGTGLIDAIVLRDATLCDCAGPAAVRRRCAADRKLLELHKAVPDHGRYSEAQCPADCDGEHSAPPVCASCRTYAGDPVAFPCPTVRVVAEGYGWTEGER
ncbi:hypothetical protein [Streptomyces sp. NBRC 110035]|uniref:hypothetical protein n=1 Tax=Streptomyces sp. NBRC 110035 TaxID=1547867 RepID=UPI0005A9F54B|nr:hypothetical protein [Streptomyces sp. NBRC 110035]